ncbi:hypothetical protein GCK72_026045 [Caenorhabditis remanei]|uniref:Uncharacterized protein n=1 Tax=Caenorhabditis remanei TaxID=31234 RepID=A0A6A5G3S1_CAERE|nr:hypothetical protein GCK72_026045 [Caenorhabditis remanei]KAF1749577.1 hypothetical protein GCK72_026045 [Caenorhabditis remanei]
MLTSSSSNLLISMPSSHCDFLKPFYFQNFKNMMFPDFLTSSVHTTRSSEFADDFGFFDSSETRHYIHEISQEIGTKLAAMCDDFDAKMMSYSKSGCTSRSLLGRFFDFFAF